jgi:hypothetical protein
MHRKKKVLEFPVPSRNVTTKLSLGGNNDVINELFLPRRSLVSDIPAGDGKLVNLFLRCALAAGHAFAGVSSVVGTTVTGVRALALVNAVAGIHAVECGSVVFSPTVAGVLAS